MYHPPESLLSQVEAAPHPKDRPTEKFWRLNWELEVEMEIPTL
ncbi:MAG: hypothetical protein U7123_14820 [Potamolinea sp.]